jgi:hypothetical protein
MRREPTQPTLATLRATRNAHRIATAILYERITTLATVPCATCLRPIAVATDDAHPASAFEGTVVCRACLRASRVAEDLAWGLNPADPEPTLELCMEELEQWVREGWVELPAAPDPRPTFRQWVDRLLRGGARHSGNVPSHD